MTLADIRAGMGRTIDVIDGANVYTYPPGSPALPTIVVGWPQEWTIDSYQRGGPTYVIPVEVLVAFVHAESADTTLMELLDATVAVLRADPSLGATCDDSAPQQVTNIGVVDIDNDRKALAATILVTVFA